MLYVYTLNQKFNTIRMLVIRDINEIWKKISHIKEDNNTHFA